MSLHFYLFFLVNHYPIKSISAPKLCNFYTKFPSDIIPYIVLSPVMRFLYHFLDYNRGYLNKKKKKPYWKKKMSYILGAFFLFFFFLFLRLESYYSWVGLNRNYRRRELNFLHVIGVQAYLLHHACSNLHVVAQVHGICNYTDWGYSCRTSYFLLFRTAQPDKPFMRN